VAGAVSAANFAQDAGRLDGAGTLTVTGGFDWTGGTQGGTGTGTTVLGAGVVLTIRGGTHAFDGRQIDNTLGSINWSSGTVTSTAGNSFRNVGLLTISSSGNDTFLSGGTLNNAGTVVRSGANDWYLQDGAVVNNLPGALFDVQNNGRIYDLEGAATFNNQGTFRRSAGTGLMDLTAGLSFNNSGTVQVQTGTLSFSSGYVQTGGSTDLAGGTLGGSLIDVQGGSLSGSGTINASVRNAGLVDPGGAGAAGQMTIAGNYTQLAGGVLNIEIGGTIAGSQYDQLIVIGSVVLDGTLNINLINGFSPLSGNKFQILTFGSHTGVFATINGLILGGGQVFLAAYNTKDLTVTAS
jgi:hypothetical protein